MQLDLMEMHLSGATSPEDLQDKILPGLFEVPICLDMEHRFISTTDMDGGRRYESC